MRPQSGLTSRRALIASAAIGALGIAGSIVASGPAGATPSAAVNYGFDRPTAVAAGAGHLWIANLGGNSVTETTVHGGFVRTLRAAKYRFHSPDAITVAGADVFVLNRAGSVTEVAATNGSLVRVIHGQRFGFARPVAMVAHAGKIWVANRATGTITEFRAGDGSLVRLVTAGTHSAWLDHPVALTAATDHLWVLNSTGGSSRDVDAGSATEIEATTGTLLRNVHAKADGIETPSGVAFDGTHIWITDSAPGTLTELSASGRLVRIVTDSSAGNVYLEYGTVVVAHKGQVYVVSPPGSSPMVSRIVAKTVTGKWYECNTNTPDPNFLNPTGLAAQGHHVWVVSPANNTLAELHVSTGQLIHDFP